MKIILLIIPILLLSCSEKCETDNSADFYIYRMNKKSKESYHIYYTEKVRTVKDSIFITRYFYDDALKVDNKGGFTYIRDGVDLYSLDYSGIKRLYFTMKSRKNVLFNVRYVMQDDDFLKLTDEEMSRVVEEPPSPIIGFNHRYLKDTTLIDLKGDSVFVHKFFVNRSYYEDKRNNINEYSAVDYFYYYTVDFLLYKTEYLGCTSYDAWEPEIIRLGTVTDVFMVE